MLFSPPLLCASAAAASKLPLSRRSLALAVFSSSQPPRSEKKTVMSGDRTPKGRSGRGVGSPHGRGRGSVYLAVRISGKPECFSRSYREMPTISPFNEHLLFSSSKPSMYREVQSSIFSSIDHVKKGSSDVKGPESDSEVCSGRSREDRSSRFTVECRNRSPQRPKFKQTSDIVKRSSAGSGPRLDFEVSSGRSPIYRDDWSSRSSIDERAKSLQSSNVHERTESKDPVTLNKSLLEINREKRRVREHSKHDSHVKYLRSGMVLLKNYIGHDDQVRIIRSCRKLGIGEGGFYRPGYSNGAKLHLHMMCLGKNWDPESRLYEDIRTSDGAKPPSISDYFRKLVADSIQAAYDFLQLKNKGINVEDELPWMSPDFCVVNFFSNSGKLGLHQDRDESEESIHKGLPIVSFSLGDSAEFLYGDKRDVDIAEKVVLESGDILIFGGKSRLLFHGVSSIIPNTAPKSLIDETKLKPGRLNLTFRQ